MFHIELIFLPENLKFCDMTLYINICNLYFLDNITSSVKSISKSFNNILRVNTAVVTYLRDIERRKKTINQTTENIHPSGRNDN